MEHKDYVGIKEYLGIIQKRLWLILVIPLILALTAAVLSIFVLKAVYKAETTLIVGRVPIGQADRLDYTDMLLYEKLIKTYTELAKSKSVISETLSKLNYNIPLSEMKSNLEVAAKGDSQIIEISVLDKSGERAANISNALSQIFIEKVRILMKSNDVEIMDMASTPTKPVKPNKALNISIAFLLGLIISLSLAFIIEYLDSTLKTEADIERHIALTALANIPYVKSKKNRPQEKMKSINLATFNNSRSPISEAYRTLRTNIGFMSYHKNIKTIVITSASPHEGKTTAAANLAITMAQAGSRVIIIDCDLRNPSIHKMFMMLNGTGLTNILIENAQYHEYICKTYLKNLDLIMCGPKPPNPSELLNSAAMGELLDQLKEDYDYILIDTAPAVLVTDAAILASISDSTILVVSSGHSEIKEVLKAKELLSKGGANIIGTVNNKVKMSKNAGYYNYYQPEPGNSGGSKMRSRNKQPKQGTVDV